MSFNTFIETAKPVVEETPLVESVGEIVGKEYKFAKKDATLKFFNKFVFLFHDINDDIQYKLKNATEVNTPKFKAQHILYTTYGITEDGNVIIKGRAVLPVGEIFKTADFEYITSPRDFHKIETVYTAEKEFDNAEAAFKSISKGAVAYFDWAKFV